MRRKLSFDAAEGLTRFAMLVHGDYGAGKTYLLGDALETEAQHGPVLFVNVAGEDGYASLLGRRVPGETVESIEDLRALLKEVRGARLRALGLDSLKALYRAVGRHRVGERLPQKDDFSGIHWEGEGLVAELRTVADRVICVCPSDKSIHQLTGRTLVTPDLPGRAATGCAGWFDFVGYLSAETVGKTVRRTLTFAPSANVVTRLRLPAPITEDLVLPTGPGAWALILRALESAMTKEERNA